MESGGQRTVLRAIEIRKSFRQGDRVVPVLQGVGFSLRAGEMTAIVGPSGSGKSTLLNILGLLTEPDEGTLEVDGHDVSGLSPSERAAFRLGRIAFVFQAFHLIDHKSVFENIELPLIYAGVKRSERKRQVDEILNRLGMTHRSDSAPATLSGGEKQRVAIGRALVTKPTIMLCDEPTGSLDSERSKDVIALLREMTGPEQSTVLVTHDPWVANQCDAAITLVDGKVASERDVQADAGETYSGLAPVILRANSRWIRLGLMEAVNAVRHRFQRNAFTMLGVALGVMSLVLTVGLSATISAQLSDRFDLFLAQRVTLAPPNDGRIGLEQALAWQESPGMTRLMRLNGVEAGGVLQEVSGGAATITLAPESRTDFEGRVQAPVMATSPEGLEAQGITLERGRLFDAGHMGRADPVAVIGETLFANFDREWVEGMSIFAGGKEFRLIGLVGEDFSSSATAASLYIPLGQSATSAVLDDAPTKILLKTQPGAASQVAQEATLAWDPANTLGLSAAAPPEPDTLRQAVDEQQRSMLLGMAAVTLVIGGVGIMNTFLVAVLERSREIGLRLALGSPPAGMLTQFAAEAIFTSAVGAVIGVIGAVNVLAVVSIVNNWIPVISIQSVGLGLVAGVLMGVIAGVHPARKASLIDPIDTLSHN